MLVAGASTLATDGFLRKVTAISQPTAGTYLVATSQAALGDVLASGGLASTSNPLSGGSGSSASHFHPSVAGVEPLVAPDRVFLGLPAVDSWQPDGDRTYVVHVSDVEAAAPAVTRALVQAGAGVLSVGQSRHSLQDVYLELIDEDVEAEAH